MHPSKFNTLDFAYLSIFTQKLNKVEMMVLGIFKQSIFIPA